MRVNNRDKRKFLDRREISSRRDAENGRIIKSVLEEKIQRNTDERARQVIRNDNEIQNDLEDAPRRKKSSEQTDHKAARSK